ncbi:DUF3014 domain-containing protein [Dasania sp. GY-MA-18]|uniref:DUF3014 domain-containing protein n=1 Tax=Dasania phycosphaerae TaxID=2950436 RepID=A0A9J6RPA2_9GAMM|nr:MULTISPECIES: DUF3014 domain-containing protein [Dasania]MCR8923517.1 DUF3014 domain-containing protein [Dasania sp. GY-MA-18]MCZ0865951.1 DUF3014 domain-containing protein [Dasania phycosphaerae]MCZ0869675.1 DUF3014 domain-containing protein [Dasania phycosphaerae]
MKKSSVLGLIVVVVALVAALSYWQLQQGVEPSKPPAPQLAPEPEPAPVMRKEPEALEPVAEPEPDPNADLLPPPVSLDSSDEDVKALAESLAPSLKAWLQPQQQLRKWVATVDMMADGSFPRKYPALVYPLGKFEVEKNNGVLRASESNNKRVDALVKAVTAIDPQLLARYYRYWQPLLDKAYSEQGRSELFSDRLMKSIERIITLEPAPLRAELVQPHVFYRYKDEALEKRSDLDKMIWRLGRDNQKALQAFLTEFKQQL